MENGRSVRRGAFIDIPLVYDMPHFAKDDDDPFHGHFVLVLQSFLCHQGTRTDSGHYISAACSRNPGDGPDQWLLMDDLAKERVSYIDDIRKFLDKEKPYLLFYRVEPISSDPPPYREPADKDSGVAGLSDSQSRSLDPRDEEAVSASRHSLDSAIPEDSRGRSSMNSDRRSSVVFSDEVSQDHRTSSTPFLTPDTQRNSSEVSRHGSQVSKTASVDKGNKDKRSSISLSRLAERLSKEKSNTSLSGRESAVVQSRYPIQPSISDGPKAIKIPEPTIDYATFGNPHGIIGRHRLDKPERECVLM